MNSLSSNTVCSAILCSQYRFSRIIFSLVSRSKVLAFSFTVSFTFIFFAFHLIVHDLIGLVTPGGDDEV